MLTHSSLLEISPTIAFAHLLFCLLRDPQEYFSGDLGTAEIVRALADAVRKYEQTFFRLSAPLALMLR